MYARSSPFCSLSNIRPFPGISSRILISTVAAFFVAAVSGNPSLHAQPVTVNGTVRDMTTLFPVDSVRIDIVNTANAGERYTTWTNTSGLWAYTITPTPVGPESTLPEKVQLSQNYPNPFNPSTVIEFAIPYNGRAVVAVYDILGRRIDQRAFSLEAGTYSIPWLSMGAAGVLFYSIDFAGTRIVRKMVQLDGGGNGGLGTVTRTRWNTPQSGVAHEMAEYTVTASRIGYEPDSMTIVLVIGVRADFLLETVHNRAFFIDLHNDVLEKVVSGYQLGTWHSFNHSDIPRFRQGGVDAQMFALWADPSQFPANPYQRVLAMADSFDAQVIRNPATLGQARTEADIVALNAGGKIAGILAVEGGHAIEEDLNKLRALHARGARYLTITWNNSTSWATSAADPQSATRGLNEFGRTVIRTMDTLGMIIDVSHTGIRTIEDILATTTNPIIATHSGARALRNHYRNLTDAQLIAIAQTGGVIGVVFYPYFLSASNSATIDTVIRHVDYIRNLIGVDHVAIGSDFDGIEQTPVGLEDVSRFPALTLALLRHGYSPSDVRKIMGENFLRVFRQVCDR